MKKPSVLFVEPRTPHLNEYSTFKRDLPLFGPVGLATQLKQKGHDVTVVNENITPITKSDLRQNGAIVITEITPTAPRGYEIAMAYRRENPNGRVLIGGPHATFIPEEAIRFADNVGRFEGENIIEGMVLGDYKKGEIVDGTPVQNLDDVPIPDLSLIRGYKKRLAPVAVSRGCPHNCDFCSVTGMYGRKPRQVSVENAVEQFRRNQDARSIFVYDDNFTAKRSWVIDVLEQLVEEGFDTNWANQVRSEIGGDDELLGLLSQAHCTAVCIGYESESPEKLKEYGKGRSLSVRESVQGFHKHIIAVHGMFIYDEHTDYLNLPVDYLQVSILTPLPGSDLFGRVRKEGLFIEGMNPLADGDSWRFWKYFDGGHVVYHDPLHRGEKESFEKLVEIQERTMEILRKFYSLPNAFKKRKLKSGTFLNHGMDWKRFVFWWVAQQAQRQKRGYVDFLKYLGEKGKRATVSGINLINM
jgi:hypothetical protein